MVARSSKSHCSSVGFFGWMFRPFIKTSSDPQSFLQLRLQPQSQDSTDITSIPENPSCRQSCGLWLPIRFRQMQVFPSARRGKGHSRALLSCIPRGQKHQSSRARVLRDIRRAKPGRLSFWLSLSHFQHPTSNIPLLFFAAAKTCAAASKSSMRPFVQEPMKT